MIEGVELEVCEVSTDSVTLGKVLGVLCALDLPHEGGESISSLRDLAVAKLRSCVRLPEKPARLRARFYAAQVSLSQEDLQALGSAISVVTQSGALAVPEEELVADDTHTVTVVNADSTKTQPVRATRGLPSSLQSYSLRGGGHISF